MTKVSKKTLNKQSRQHNENKRHASTSRVTSISGKIDNVETSDANTSAGQKSRHNGPRIKGFNTSYVQEIFKKPIIVSPRLYDIWNKPAQSSSENSSPNVDRSLVNYYLRSTKQMNPKYRGSFSLKSANFEAIVKKPHPGLSYNPSYDAHQSLLKEAKSSRREELREQKKERSVKRFKADFTEYREKTSYDDDDEMFQGLNLNRNLWNDEEEEEEEEEDDESEEELYHKKQLAHELVSTKLPPFTRRKIWRAKRLLTGVRKQIKRQEDMEADIDRIGEIVNEIERKAAEKEVTQERRKLKYKVEQDFMKSLSRRVSKRNGSQVRTGGKLVGSLRQLKQAGDPLICNRFKHLKDFKFMSKNSHKRILKSDIRKKKAARRRLYVRRNKRFLLRVRK